LERRALSSVLGWERNLLEGRSGEEVLEREDYLGYEKKNSRTERGSCFSLPEGGGERTLTLNFGTGKKRRGTIIPKGQRCTWGKSLKKEKSSPANRTKEKRTEKKAGKENAKRKEPHT